MSGSEKARDDLVVSSVADHVGTILLNRPESLNAFNLQMAKQFLGVLSAFGEDENVRAVVLRGSGRVFSAGGDIREMMADVRKEADPAAYFREPLSSFGEMVMALREIPKPVLAAVHGAAAGVAFNVMLSCDLRMATESSRFTQAFIRLGLSPDGGGTWFLPRLVGAARASELALLPTELDAATALEWGLINWVVPEAEFETRVREIAGRLAAGPALAMGRTKALLAKGTHSSLQDQLEAERLAQVDNAASPDFGEGLSAFLEKRPPRFSGGST